jgi:hypothetical protein
MDIGLEGGKYEIKRISHDIYVISKILFISNKLCMIENRHGKYIA